MKRLIFVSIITILLLASCSTNPFSGRVAKKHVPQHRRLDSIALVQQPADSNLCGAAAAKMVMNYYFSESEDINSIFEQVSYVNHLGRHVNATYLIAQYLAKNGLYVTIIRFSDLESILNYCENNQIPSIMQINDVYNPMLGHSVVFVGYRQTDRIILILDPNNPFRRSINFYNLKTSFMPISPESEITLNIMILASDRLINKREIQCQFSGTMNIVDEVILDDIQGLFCINCDRFFSVNWL